MRHLYAGEVRQGSDTKQEVIVLAARHDEVDLFVEQLHRTGCTIESLDFEPTATYRSVERFIRRREDEAEVHVLIDVGARQSQVIIGKGRDLSFFKPIDIGAQHLHESVARKLAIGSDEARALRRRLIDAATGSEAGAAAQDPVRQAVFDATRSTCEELAREISLCLRYYSVTFRGQRPNKVRLLGGEAADPQLQAALAGALPISVEAGRPLYSVNTDAMRQIDSCGSTSEWALALGLGLKLTRARFGRAMESAEIRSRRPRRNPPPRSLISPAPCKWVPRSFLRPLNRTSVFGRSSMCELEFLPEWYPRIQRRKRLVVLSGWMTVIVAVAFLLWTLLAHHNVRVDEAMLSSLESQVVQNKTEQKQLDEQLAIKKQLEAQARIVATLGFPVEMSRLLRTLDAVMPKEMSLIDVSFDTVEQQVSAAVATGTAAARATPGTDRPAADIDRKLKVRLIGVSPTDVDLANFLAGLTSLSFLQEVALVRSDFKSDSGHLMREFEVTFSMDLNQSLGK